MSAGAVRGRVPGLLAIGVVAALGLCAAGCAPHDGLRDDELLVAAASSLRDVVEETLPAFRAVAPGVDVRVSYAASSRLSEQIAQGAPYDVFLSADAPCVERLGGLVEAGSSRVVLGNLLAMVGRADLADAPDEPAALAGRALRVALAGPAVPAGRYARDWLDGRGLLASLGDVVLGDSVRGTLALVEAGAADVGFVYLTDARASRDARLLWTAPPGSGPPIGYVAVATRAGAARTPHAAAFLDWLHGEVFLAAAARAGFAPPPLGD